MTNFRDERHQRRLPTHEEIEKRAYELSLKNGEDRHDVEHWLIAEEELRLERAAQDNPTLRKTEIMAAGSGDTTKKAGQ